jgi:ankyrin repeat protein
MDDVPDFADPNAWVIKKCMKALLFEEHCDPNIQDNYGETLLNFAVKTKKLQSLDYILTSKNANVNAPNAIGITPIG